jgi:hypothetical protein
LKIKQFLVGDWNEYKIDEIITRVKVG